MTIFLIESWTNINSQIDLPNYPCYNFYRKFKHKNAKRTSGGLVFYIKSDINADIEDVRNHYDSILWLKIDKTFFI